MPTLTVSDARKNLFGLVDAVAEDHCGYCIVGKRNQAVLISMEDWNAIQESLYLNGIPGVADSYGGGTLKGSSEIMRNSFSTFARRPDDTIFLASRSACFV